MEFIGNVRWIPATPNDASRNNTPLAQIATTSFKLQQLWRNAAGKETWVDVKVADEHGAEIYG